MLILAPPSLSEITWELEREKCMRSFSCFVKRMWNVVEPGVKLLWGWHLEAICSHLQAVDEGQFNRLIICIPPGFGKSTIISVLWPAWTWLHMPWIRSLFGSYDESLTFRDSIKCRDVIKSKLYQRLFHPEWSLRKDVDSKSYFANTMHGSRKTYYITSSHKTGWRGNYAVIDDSLSAENRFNAAVKAAVFDSWENVISTRVNRSQHHAYVIIMQRLAYDDLVGRLIEKYGDQYVRLILSNEYEPEYHCTTPIFSDPRTIPGELLAPDFFPAERTEESKFSLRDEYVGQFLQRPMPIGGVKFQSQYFLHWRWTEHHLVIELTHRDGRKEHIRIDRCENLTNHQI